MKKLDATNRLILKILQKDGSTTNTELSRQLGLSPASTLERVKKLEKNGFIRKYTVLVDPEKVGKTFTAFIEITMTDHSAPALELFLEAVKEIPEILECHHVAGDKDYILKVITDDIKAYEHLAMDKLAHIPHIGRINTMIVISSKKQTSSIPL